MHAQERQRASASQYLHLLPSARGCLAFNSLTLESFILDELEESLLSSALEGEEIEITPQNSHLLEAGLLTIDHVDGLEAIEKLIRLRRNNLKRRSGHFGTLRLALTEKCNMACSYCFQQQMYPESQPVLSRKQLDETLEWFINQGEGSYLTVQYFGGEPLLEWDNLVRAHDILARAKSDGIIKGFRETITTNGTLMTKERAEWLVSKEFDLTFSFDGPPEQNDKYRLLRSGRGTYKLAERGLKLWSEAGGQPSILMTATQETLTALPEYIRWFVEDSGLSPEVIGINSPQPTTMGWETGGVHLATAIWKIWNYCNQAGVIFHGPGTFIANHLIDGTSRSDTCVDTGDKTMPSWPVYVNANGKKSLCVVHHQDYRVMPRPNETVFDAGLRWHNTSEPQVKTCNSCIASQFCGGPCALEKILWQGKLSNDRCEFMQEMTKLILTEG